MDDRLESIVEGDDSGSPPGIDSNGLRTVVIHRGERGYGVTVSGEGPVIVQDVKDGGPAAQAGVKKGDSIIKVNGNLVSQVNHKDVVQIIKSTQFVKLTLKSSPEGEVPSISSPQDPTYRPVPSSAQSTKPHDRTVTAPLPVNTQLQNQMEVNKGKMLTMYLEKQRRVRDNIHLELQRGPSKVLQKNLEKELDSINRQISKIQEELKNMKDIEAQLLSHPRPSPRSPPPSRPSFSQPHFFPQSHHPTHTRSVSEIPPPLPARNRSLVTQISAPSISMSSTSLSCAPPLPPRPSQLERVGEGGLAQSLENIHKVQSLTHSASSVSEPGTRLPSHYRAKSSPDPLGLQISPGSCRLSGSDSISDISFTGSSISRGKVSSASNDDSSIAEPPGTPPPPYTSTSTLPPYPLDDGDDNYSVIMDDCDGGGDVAPSAPPLPSPPGPPLPSRPTLPSLPSKPGSHHSSPFTSQVTSPTSPNGQVGTASNVAGLLPTQPILSMEDEEFSDPEPLEDHGPFQTLSKLWDHNAYLAVFMNYVISNCDSSSLFFYIITKLYKDGVGKEMKRWAYEITSSFLLPGAPLRLSNVEENVLHEIDETLHNELDKEEILRKVFWKARQKCREELTEQLGDFRNKRSAGLGSIFGPPDHALEESIHNKAKELQIVEHLLVPCLETVSEDLKNATEQMIVTASSLATILLKYFCVRSQQAHQLGERCPLYVSKERPLRSKIFRGSKKQVYRDHHFNQHTYYNVTYCNHCGLIIWGIAPQGYQCTNCEMNIHKSCAKQVEEVCIGQLHKKDRRSDMRFSTILGKIMPEDKDNRRKVSQVSAAQIKEARKVYEEGSNEILGRVSEDGLTGDKVSCASGGCASGNKEQRRSDPGSVGGVTVSNNHTSSSTPASTNTTHTNASTTSTDLTNNVGDSVNDFASPDTASPNVCSSTDSPPLAALAAKPNLQKKKSGVSINRSESCKEKQPGRKRTRENRKHSDPNIPTSKSGDVDAESNLISGNSGSSSNSSLSQSLESPSTSLEQVSRPDAPLPTPVLENDSDIEAEVDLPNWQQPLSHEQIKRLKPKERKRQDTINELFHTERTHVRILKVLKHLFHMPMAEAGLLPKDQLDMLFPNLDQILEIHTNFNQSMKKRRQEEALVLRVGDLLSAMFDGEKGDHFQQQAAEFVRQQSISLENLKQRQKRDQRLCNFLQEQENNPACRRLQLKDMLPAGFQRLTKYPLLMESLLAYTDSNKHPEEYEQISRALERAKEILAHVNAAVQEAENNQRLSEIQRRLDQSSLAKNKSGLSDELKGNLDLTKHKLIHEGPLTWRIAKGQKNIDLLVLLLEEFIVLLQKSDDKYILKNHSISKSLVKDDYKLTHSPIIKYGPSMLFRAVATDRCAFFIVTTQSIGAHIYEFVAISANERKVWFRHIQEAQEAYTARDGRNRRSHPPTPLPDPDDQAPAAADAIRDVDDGDDDGGEMTEGTNDIAGETKLQTGGVSNSPEQTGKSDEWSSSTTTPAAASQTPGSPDTLSKKTEHLRRKDIKIRQALEEKQHIIADILNIPHEHFENVADMAGEPAVGNKEPRELVLAAMFQAKCLQETLNEALNIGEGDIIAARTNNDGANKASSLPLYQAPMTKLMNISTALSQQLSSLLNLVSERDDERERMRKELVASRERLHLFHMKQNSISSQPLSTATVASVTPPTATSPHTSRPSSFVSVSSSAADHSDTPDHHDTDEEGRNEVPKISSMPLEEGGDPKEESVLEAFEDAVSGSESTEIPPHDSEPPAGREDCGEETSSDRGCEINTETSTT